MRSRVRLRQIGSSFLLSAGLVVAIAGTTVWDAEPAAAGVDCFERTGLGTTSE